MTKKDSGWHIPPKFYKWLKTKEGRKLVEELTESHHQYPYRTVKKEPKEKWDKTTFKIAKACGLYEGGAKYNFYNAGRIGDSLVITHRDLVRILKKRFKLK